MAVNHKLTNVAKDRVVQDFRQISEDRATIVIECEDESAFDVTIVDPGSSVAVRDKNHQVEYLG
jgi:hypothetical protein